MKRCAVLMAIVLCTTVSIHAGSVIESIDPIQSAMARTCLSQNSCPSVMLSNPALLGIMPDISLAMYYTRPYGLAELELTNLSGSMQYGRFTAGLSFSHSGDAELITTGIFSVALEYQFLKYMNLGIRCDYRRDSFAEDYDDRDMFSFALGIAARYDDLIFHAALSEVNRPRLCDSDPKTEPGCRVGISFMNLSYLVLNLELSGRGEESRFHFGQELLLAKYFFLRLGLVTNPTLPSAGLGIRYDRFSFNYGIDRHSTLGETHSFGVAVSF